MKIKFPSEKESSIIPLQFLGDISDYNGVDITQTPDYIEILSKNYIACLLKIHGWGIESDSSSIASENLSKEDVATTSKNLPKTLQNTSTTGTKAAAASA